jgi:hypothetical protein
MSDEYKYKIELKEKEYSQHFHQLDLHYQSHIESIKTKITELEQQNIDLKRENQIKLDELIQNKQNSIDEQLKEKNKSYQQIKVDDQLIKKQIEYFKTHQNEEQQLNNDLYQRNIELIHLSYRNKLKDIKNKFFQVNLSPGRRLRLPDTSGKHRT